METFSTLLAHCAGNSPVTGEFPAQRPVTQNFDVSLIYAWINDWVNNRLNNSKIDSELSHFAYVILGIFPETHQAMLLQKVCSYYSVFVDLQSLWSTAAGLCIRVLWIDFNSLAPGKFELNFRYVIFKRISGTDGWVEASLVKSP